MFEIYNVIETPSGELRKDPHSELFLAPQTFIHGIRFPIGLYPSIYSFTQTGEAYFNDNLPPGIVRDKLEAAVLLMQDPNGELRFALPHGHDSNLPIYSRIENFLYPQHFPEISPASEGVFMVSPKKHEKVVGLVFQSSNGQLFGNMYATDRRFYVVYQQLIHFFPEIKDQIRFNIAEIEFARHLVDAPVVPIEKVTIGSRVAFTFPMPQPQLITAKLKERRAENYFVLEVDTSPPTVIAVFRDHLCQVLHASR